MTVHTVQKGDTLWKIAQQHHLQLDSLIAANPQITDPNNLEVGIQVMIPSDMSVGKGLSGQLNATGMGPLPLKKSTAPKEKLTAPILPELPKLEIPKVEVPSMEKKEMPKMEMPKLPKMEMPKMQLPKVEFESEKQYTSTNTSTNVSPMTISDDDTEIVQQLYYAPHYHMAPPMPVHAPKKPPRVQCFTIFPGFIPVPPGMSTVYQGPAYGLGGTQAGYGFGGYPMHHGYGMHLGMQHGYGMHPGMQHGYGMHPGMQHGYGMHPGMQHGYGMHPGMQHGYGGNMGQIKAGTAHTKAGMRGEDEEGTTNQQ